jgi:hypothetical protein
MFTNIVNIIFHDLIFGMLLQFCKSYITNILKNILLVGDHN